MSGRSRTSVEVPMSDRDQLYPLDQRAWLLAIGRFGNVPFRLREMCSQLFAIHGGTFAVRTRSGMRIGVRTGWMPAWQ